MSFWFFLNSEFLMLSRGTIPNRCHWHGRNIISAEEPPPSLGSGNIRHEMNEVPPRLLLRCPPVWCGLRVRRQAPRDNFCNTWEGDTGNGLSGPRVTPGQKLPAAQMSHRVPNPLGPPQEHARVPHQWSHSVCRSSSRSSWRGEKGWEIQVAVQKRAMKTLQGDTTAHLRVTDIDRVSFRRVPRAAV